MPPGWESGRSVKFRNLALCWSDGAEIMARLWLPPFLPTSWPCLGRRETDTKRPTIMDLWWCHLPSRWEWGLTDEMFTSRSMICYPWFIQMISFLMAGIFHLLIWPLPWTGLVFSNHLYRLKIILCVGFHHRLCLFIEIIDQEQLRPYMSKMKPRPSIYSPDFIAANQSDRADNVMGGSKREQVEQIRKDIRDFRA